MKNKIYREYAYYLWTTYLKKKWPMYVLGIFSVVCTNVAQVWAPKNLGWIIDFFTDRPIPEFFIKANKQETFVYLFLLLLGSRLFLSFFRFMWRICLGRQSHHAAGFLRFMVWENALFFKQDDLNKRFTKGMLISATASDCMSARNIYGMTLIGIIDVLFLGIFSFLAMAMIHLPLTLATFASLLFIPIFVKKVSEKEIASYRELQEKLGELNDLSSQSVSTIKLQRLSQTGPFWLRKLMSLGEVHRQKKLETSWISLDYTKIMSCATIISYLFLFAWGAYLVLNKQVTPGEFVALQNLIFLLHDPLMSLGFVISEWKKGFAALERLSEIYVHEKEEPLFRPGLNVKNDNRPVVFDVKNLSYTFEDGMNLFNNLSFKLHKGQRLGITGTIGAGKTTLLQLISGLNQKYDGEIKFYEEEVKNYSHESLSHHITQVSQRPFLFADSIRVNVAMDHELSDEEIWKYLELAGLKEDVENFPYKLDTQLGEWGINLSGGQKQRLTLARALARKPDVLLLDDCLSAVDTITEEKILRNLDSFLKDSTIIWIAHRQSTLKYCDFVFEIKGHHETVQ